MIYFHSFKNPGLVLDIVQDIRSLNEKARMARKAGMIILGGGVCKHQIANAMLIVRPFLSVSALPIYCSRGLMVWVLDWLVAKRSGLLRLCRTSSPPPPPLPSHLTEPPMCIEHRPRIRRLRLRRPSRRGRLMGQNPRGLRVRESVCGRDVGVPDAGRCDVREGYSSGKEWEGGGGARGEGVKWKGWW